jgi:hypothetical protein
MTFESWMSCEIYISDGNYTIGYVDGNPAEWQGNNTTLSEGDEFSFRPEDSTFGVSVQDEFVVQDGRWEEQI